MKTPLLIFGSMGASKEAYYLAKDINALDETYEILGFIDEDESRKGVQVTDGKKVVGTDLDLETIIGEFVKVALVIPFGDPGLKKKIFEKVKRADKVYFPNLIHPSVITSNIIMGEGNLLSPGVVLACDSKMGNFNLINRCATLGHDVILGDYNSICPGAVVSGNVNIGDSCNIGANAAILQGLDVKSETVVGAGAVVTKSTVGKETLVGIPAKRIKNG